MSDETLYQREERLRRELEEELAAEDDASDEWLEARRAFDEREPELETYGLRVEPSPGGTAYGIYPRGTSDAGVASGRVRPLAWIEDRLPIQRDFDRAADRAASSSRGSSSSNPSGVRSFSYKRDAVAFRKELLEQHPGRATATVMRGADKYGRRTKSTPWLVYWDVEGPRGGAPRRNPDAGDILRSFHAARRESRGWATGGGLEAIEPGDRVTIRDRFGKERTGKAVMRGPHGWVLNMGGAHGTPAIASAENIVKVKGPARSKRNPPAGARAASNPKGVQRFLVNPDGRRAKPRRKAMAKRRTPPRHKSGPKKGQFMSRSARRRRARRNPGRTVAPAALSNPRRRRRRRSSSRPRARRRVRRNPPRRFPAPRQLVRTLTDGMIGAGQVLVGKAFVRSVPDLAGLPKEGNVGLAVQAAVALVGGILADMFLSKDASRAILYGGLSAPAETVIVAYKVPWLSSALSPVSATAGLSAYVTGAPGMSLGRYSRERLPAVSNDRGLGSYVSASSR